MSATYRIRKPNHVDAQSSGALLPAVTRSGLPNVGDLYEEILEYWDVMFGRKPSPIASPYLALAEVATAFYARAQEIDSLIHAGEREGDIVRGSPLYKFRTGELRSFIEASRRVAELGSRRLTQEQLLHDQRFEDTA